MAETTESAGLLADEIRQGIDEAPHSLDESLASGVCDRAERFIVPAVEPGASFSRVKKLLLRILRVATRSQGTFNAIVVEGLRELESGTAALQRESARQAEMLRRLRDESARARIELDKVRHEYDIVQARLSAAETVRPPAASSSISNVPSASLPEGFYLRFEEEFRGPEEAIRE